MRIFLVLLLLVAGCSESFSDLRDEQEMLIQKRALLQRDFAIIYIDDPLNGNPEKEAKIKAELEKVDARLTAIADKIKSM